MRAVVGIVVTVVLVASSLAVSAAEPMVNVEFRRAETEPAPGLTAARVPGTGSTIYLHDQTDLTNADIASAETALSEDGKYYVVKVTMTDEGARKLKELTRQHLMKPLAILIDGKLLTAPRIISQLSRKLAITGAFDRGEAERIAAAFLGKKAP